MRRLLPVLALLLLLPLPCGASTAPPDEGPPVLVNFEFDRTAVRPPVDVEGFLVLESRSSEAVVVNGSVLLGGGGLVLHPAGESGEPTEQEPLARVDEEMEPFSTLRVPVTVPVQGVGGLRVQFVPDDGSKQRIHGLQDLVGVAPVEVSLEDPQDAVQMVGLPGQPAGLTLTLTALEGSGLTDLRLTSRFAQEVEVGDLAPGESRTVTLTFETHDDGVHRESGAVDRVREWPELSGVEAGLPFNHPLHWSDGDRLVPVQPDVYLAQGSTAFLVPPVEARLAEPTALEVVVLNAGTTAIRAEGRVAVRIQGLPMLDEAFDLDVRVGPESVETVRLDWTPSAAGPWYAELEHDVHRFGRDVSGILVAGPFSRAEFVVPREALERGAPVSVPVVLTASQDVEVEGVRLTSSRAPLSGVVSINDLLRVGTVQGTSIAAGETERLELELVPLATGSYDLYLVVDTPEGPSVHSTANLVVGGVSGGWLAAWSPTFGVMLLLGIHVTWRRRWVR